ncbi:hypothetical protein JCM10914_1079 [Paenibacillus sp. JCM 10914]|nr:hypothetical protein JCM10914_1079 [Paenibacillus sp. JCM 10914]
MELDCIARRLKLTGWVRNLKDGSVEAELQGEESQIDFLIQCMCSLKRASVQNKTITDLPNKLDEDSFAIAE